MLVSTTNWNKVKYPKILMHKFNIPSFSILQGIRKGTLVFLHSLRYAFFHHLVCLLQSVQMFASGNLLTRLL